MRRFLLHLLALAAVPAALTAQQPALEIQMPGARVVTLSQPALQALTSDTIRLTPHHGEPTLYRAATLSVVFAAVGLPLDSLRVGRNAWTIVAEARDGYVAAFTVAEVDPRLGPSRVWLAYETSQGQLPAAEAPFRLIVPTDSRQARAARQVVRLRVIDATGR